MDYSQIEETRKLVYFVKINHPGKYYLKVRNYHTGKGSGGHAFDGDNDCFISINKSSFGKQYDHNVREFTWCETGIWRSAMLSKGVYEIAMGGRSFDFGADRIALFHGDLAPADDFGPSPHHWVDDFGWSSAPASEYMIGSAGIYTPGHITPSE